MKPCHLTSRPAGLALAWPRRRGRRSAQTLRIGLAEDPDVLDPTLARSFVGRMVFAACATSCSTSTTSSTSCRSSRPSYEWSADGKALTLKLRPGVTFHDGEKFDAAAVKFNIERHKTMPGSQPPRRARAGRERGRGRSEDGAPQSVGAVRAVARAARRSRRHDGLAQGGAGRRATSSAPIRCAPGPFKLRRARRAGPHRARALSRILEQGRDPFRQDGLSADRRLDGAPRQLRSGQLDFIERMAPSDMPALKTDAVKISKITEIGYQGITMNVGKSDLAQEESARHGTPACAKPSSLRSTARASCRW